MPCDFPYVDVEPLNFDETDEVIIYQYFQGKHLFSHATM
jgi:hypothetical protein